jgi:hypothetical protein
MLDVLLLYNVDIHTCFPPPPPVLYRGRILRRNWDKSLTSFPPCYSQSPLLTDFTPPPFLSKSGLKLVCNVKSEIYQGYAQKPQRNCTFMNLASVQYLCSS